MKNIQIIDGAENATFSVFQATDEEFDDLFIEGADMELIEDVIARLGEGRVIEIVERVWERPVLERDANGIHGTLFYDWASRKQHLPATKREIDFDEGALNEAQRRLFRDRR